MSFSFSKVKRKEIKAFTSFSFFLNPVKDSQSYESKKKNKKHSTNVEQLRKFLRKKRVISLLASNLKFQKILCRIGEKRMFILAAWSLQNFPLYSVPGLWNIKQEKWKFRTCYSKKLINKSWYINTNANFN